MRGPTARADCATVRAGGNPLPSSGAFAIAERTHDARATFLRHAAPGIGCRRNRIEKMDFRIHARIAEHAQYIREELLAAPEWNGRVLPSIAAITQRDRLHRHVGIERGLEDSRMKRADLVAVAAAAFRKDADGFA